MAGVTGADSSGRGGIGRDRDADTSVWARPDDADESGGCSASVLGEQSGGTLPASAEQAGMPTSAPSSASGEIGRDHDADTSVWARPDDADESGGCSASVLGEQSGGTLPASAEQAGMPTSAPSSAWGEIGRTTRPRRGGGRDLTTPRSLVGAFRLSLPTNNSTGRSPIARAGRLRVFAVPGAAGIAVLALLVGWAIGRDDGDRVDTVEGPGGRHDAGCNGVAPCRGFSARSGGWRHLRYQQDRSVEWLCECATGTRWAPGSAR